MTVYILLVITIGVSSYFRLKYKKLNKLLVNEIHKFKGHISGTTEQVQGSCLQLDEATNSQVSAITQISSSMHEIDTLAKGNKTNFESVTIKNNEIKSSMQKSLEALGRVENSVELTSTSNREVIELLRKTTIALGDLTKLFSEVESKTEMINDIVFQTKLLSFNASVEAARAGEHGKGFAVVAEEIGALAKGSGDSAVSIQETLEQTNNKVNSIATEINTNATKLEQMLNSNSQESEKNLGELKEYFSSVELGSKEIDFEIKRASESMSEQVSAMNEITSSTLEINHSLQQNTLVVGQTEKLASELAQEIYNFESSLVHVGLDLSKVDNKVDQIKWSNKYLIGVGQMDNEHQILLDKMNILIDAMNGKDKGEIKQAFVDMKNYTVEHFTHEEQYMRKNNYSSYDSHKRVHENLLNAVGRFEQQIENDQLDPAKLASFLKNWLFTHIMGVDTKYADEIGKKGRSFSSAA